MNISSPVYIAFIITVVCLRMANFKYTLQYICVVFDPFLFLTSKEQSRHSLPILFPNLTVYMNNTAGVL
jgi:hypothetical protein